MKNVILLTGILWKKIALSPTAIPHAKTIKVLWCITGLKEPDCSVVFLRLPARITRHTYPTNLLFRMGLLASSSLTQFPLNRNDRPVAFNSRKPLSRRFRAAFTSEFLVEALQAAVILLQKRFRHLIHFKTATMAHFRTWLPLFLVYMAFAVG